MTGETRATAQRGRLLLWMGVGVVVVLAAAVVWKGPNAIRRWQAKRFLEQGRALVEAGNYQEASMMLRKAILKAPTSLESPRLMADVLKRAQSPLEVQWRARVEELGGTNLQDRLSFAEAALRASDGRTAALVLDRIDASDRTGARYHKLAGILATANGQRAEAEKHLLEAIRLEPTNSAPKLNLAAIRLSSTNAAEAKAGRAEMVQLATDASAVRHEALRHLAGDALRHQQPQQAVAYAEQLVRGTNVAFPDRILHLNTLQAAKSPALPAVLNQTQAAAGTNVVAVAEVARWMYLAGQPGEAVVWMRRQPVPVRTTRAVRLLTVECLAKLKDNAALAAFLDSESWGEDDYYRLALQTRLQRMDNAASAADILWQRALRAASARPERMIQLVRLTREWGWKTEYETALKTAMERWPSQGWPLQELSSLYYATGQTRSLQTVLTAALERNPQDTMLKNNLAMTWLLLSPQDPQGPRLANEAYAAAGTNLNVLSTYAFALICQDKPEQALALYGTVDASKLADPSMATYYGLALAKAGRKAEAAKYLELGSKARLLPEESNLLAQARARL